MHQVQQLLPARHRGVTTGQFMVVLAATLVYVGAYCFLYADVGRAVEVVVTLPVMVAGGLWGFPAGLAAGILALPLNGFLATLVAGGNSAHLLHPGSAALFLIVVVLGGVVGWLHDLGKHLDHEMFRHGQTQEKQARQIEQLQAALSQSRVFCQTTSALLSIREHPWLLQAVVDGVVEAVQADRAALVLFNENSEQITQLLKSGNGASKIPVLFFEEMKRGLCGQVVRDRKARLLEEGGYDPQRFIFSRSRSGRADSGAAILIPITHTARCFGLLAVINAPGERQFTEQDLELLQALCRQTAIALQQTRRFERIQKLAVTDELTGLQNRRGISRAGEQLVTQAARQKRGLAAIMIDIDHFKCINDQWGHAVGDEVLQQIARRLQRAAPQAEVIGRYGGEEFAILLPERDLDTAWLFAEKVRQQIARRAILTSCGKVYPTISLGVATLGSNATDLATLFKQADKALYAAKAGGRNRVMVAA